MAFPIALYYTGYLFVVLAARSSIQYQFTTFLIFPLLRVRMIVAVAFVVDGGMMVRTITSIMVVVVVVLRMCVGMLFRWVHHTRIIHHPRR